MRGNWTEATLGEVATWSTGKNLSASKRNRAGAYPILGANGIIGRTNEVLLDCALITVGRVGACGETHRSAGPVWVSDNALIAIPNNRVVIDYLYHVLSVFDYKTIISGTTQPLITQNKLKNQVIQLPPLADQKRIADVIGTVDIYIATLQQQAEDARAARNAVLHELLNAGGDGWTERALGEIADVIMGRQLSPSKKLGVRPRPYLRAANIGTWGISLDDILEMDFTESEEKHFTSVAGDVLMVEGGNEKSVGCPALVTKREEGLCIQNTVIRCRVKDTAQLLPEYLYQFLRMSFWNGQFAELCAGTTIMHLGQKRAVAHSVSFPPLSEQERIVGIVSAMDDVVHATERAVSSAHELRSGLLFNLLSGDHEIPGTYDRLLGVA